MFIKPLEPDAITNVNVVTNRRVYSLVLRAAADSETRSAFQVRFRYPDEDVNLHLLGAAQRAAEFPNLKSLRPGTLNYDYLYKGHESIKPRVTFDNPAAPRSTTARARCSRPSSSPAPAPGTRWPGSR